MQVGLKGRGQVRDKQFVDRHTRGSKSGAHRVEKQSETRERRAPIDFEEETCGCCDESDCSGCGA